MFDVKAFFSLVLLSVLAAGCGSSGGGRAASTQTAFLFSGGVRVSSKQEAALVVRPGGFVQISAPGAQVKVVTAKGEAERIELQKRVKLIETELARLQEERAVLIAQVDPEVLERYERLLRSKGDLAVVAIKHGNCGGCHLNLPPQIVHNARAERELTSCSYCGRILYWQNE